MSIQIGNLETKDYAEVHIIPDKGHPKDFGIDPTQLIGVEDLPARLKTLFPRKR